MNTVPALQLIALSSRLALTGLVAFILGVVLDTQPLAFFACAASILVLLIVAGDYAPRTSRPRSPSAEIVPFAPTPAPIAATVKRAA